MKKRLIFAISSLCLLAFTSCEKDVDIAPVEEVVPLQVGNEWLYNVTDYDTKGNLLTTSSYKNAVLRDTTILNSTWYILSDGNIVQNSQDGYVNYNEAGSQAIMIYQSPAHGGIGYRYNYPNYDMTVLTTRSQTLDSVTTAATSYASYIFKIEKQYTQHDGATHIVNQDDYVSPGVGLVRTDKFYVDSRNVMQRHELVSYTLK